MFLESAYFCEASRISRIPRRRSPFCTLPEDAQIGVNAVLKWLNTLFNRIWHAVSHWFWMDFSSIWDGFSYQFWMDFSGFFIDCGWNFLWIFYILFHRCWIVFSDQYYIDFLTILGGFSHKFGVDFSIDVGWVFQTILHVLLIDSLSIFHRFWVDLSIDFELICP